MLLVTGGYDGGHLSSTEILPLSSPTAWTLAASLPRAVFALHVASLPGGLYCAGGEDGRSDRDEVKDFPNSLKSVMSTFQKQKECVPMTLAVVSLPGAQIHATRGPLGAGDTFLAPGSDVEKSQLDIC